MKKGARRRRAVMLADDSDWGSYPPHAIFILAWARRKTIVLGQWHARLVIGITAYLTSAELHANLRRGLRACSDKRSEGPNLLAQGGARGRLGSANKAYAALDRFRRGRDTFLAARALR
jgi:hypothetical protein